MNKKIREISVENLNLQKISEILLQNKEKIDKQLKELEEAKKVSPETMRITFTI